MAVQPEIHLRPDRGAKYAIVAGVMASAQRLGLTKIGIVGSEQFINE
jgi:biopolymer transport protein ExbD